MLLRITILLAVVACVGTPAVSDTLTITLDDVSVSAPDVVWYEAGIPLWFSDTTFEDEYPGYCLVNPDINLGDHHGVYIWPARLNADLSGASGFHTVEVDVYETHFAGSTRAFLYTADGTRVAYAESVQELTHTLSLPVGGAAVTEFSVSAHESAVWEIRLVGAGSIVPAPGQSFGAVKALYR